jgi:hypothetical protein
VKTTPNIRVSLAELGRMKKELMAASPALRERFEAIDRAVATGIGFYRIYKPGHGQAKVK